MSSREIAAGALTAGALDMASSRSPTQSDLTRDGATAPGQALVIPMSRDRKAPSCACRCVQRSGASWSVESSLDKTFAKASGFRAVSQCR